MTGWTSGTRKILIAKILYAFIFGILILYPWDAGGFMITDYFTIWEFALSLTREFGDSYITKAKEIKLGRNVYMISFSWIIFFRIQLLLVYWNTKQ